MNDAYYFLDDISNPHRIMCLFNLSLKETAIVFFFNKKQYFLTTELYSVCGIIPTWLFFYIIRIIYSYNRN